MKRSHAGIALCSVIAGATTAAHADQVFVEVQGTQGNVGRGITVSLSDGLTFWDGSTSKLMWVGHRSLAVDGQLVQAYSAEITRRAGNGWHDVVGVQDSLGDSKAAAIQALFSGAGRGEFAQSDEAIAFQTLLWEIVYDYDGSDESIDLHDGSLSFGMVNQTIFDALKGTALRGGGTPVVQIMTHSALGDHFRIVPLPSASALTCLGLLGLASRRTRP